MAEVADVAIRARLDDFERDMRKIPGISEKEIRSASRAMAKAWKLPEPDAGRVFEKRLQGLKQGASVFIGGAANDMEDLATGFGALGAAAAPVALGLAGVAAAAGGIVAGGALAGWLYSAADATGELKDEQDALSAAMLDLKTDVGDYVLPLFEGFIKVAIISTLAAKDFAASLLDGFDSVGRWYAALSPLAKGMVDAADGGFSRAAAAMVKLNEGGSDGLEIFGSYNDRANELIGSVGKVAEKQGKAATETARHTTATREHTTALEHEIAALMARDEWMEKAVELDAREATLDDELTQQIIGNMRDIEVAQGAQRDTAAAAKEELSNTRDAWASFADAGLGAVGTVGDALLDLPGLSRGAATAIAATQKAAAVAGITVNALVAGSRAWADLGPIAGPIAAAAIGISAAGSIAAVGATQSSFHVGGMIGGGGGMAPDEVGVRARRGEAVMTAGAVAQLGGPAGVSALNSGRPAPMQIRVQQVYQHRGFGEFVSDELRMRSSPLGRAVRGKAKAGRSSG